jgi:hypothetical protein
VCPDVATTGGSNDTCRSFETEEDPVADQYTGNAYCVKCKEKRDFTGEISLTKTGRPMAKGKCPVCGTTMNRILSKADVPNAGG